LYSVLGNTKKASDIEDHRVTKLKQIMPKAKLSFPMNELT